MNTWQERKRSKQRQQTLRNNIRFRQNLREVTRNEKSIEKLCSQYIAQALEAEGTDHHSLAVRLAGEAARLRKHQTVTANMRGSLEIAHAVQSTNQAMLDMMKTSRSAAGSMMPDAVSPDMCQVQSDLATMQEYTRDYMEQSEMFFEDFQQGDGMAPSEEDERYLKALMNSSNKEKQLRLLQSTNSRLEKLQRNRPTDHEGSKQP